MIQNLSTIFQVSGIKNNEDDTHLYIVGRTLLLFLVHFCYILRRFTVIEFSRLLMIRFMYKTKKMYTITLYNMDNNEQNYELLKDHNGKRLDS